MKRQVIQSKPKPLTGEPIDLLNLPEGGYYIKVEHDASYMLVYYGLGEQGYVWLRITPYGTDGPAMRYCTLRTPPFGADLLYGIRRAINQGLEVYHYDTLPELYRDIADHIEQNST